MQTSQIDMTKHEFIILVILTFLLVLIALFCFLLIIAICQRHYVNIHKKKRKLKRKAIPRRLCHFLISLVAIFMIVPVIISNCKTVSLSGQIFDLISEEKKTKETVSQELTEALQNIPFQNEIINEEETPWERLLNQWLMYDKYCSCSKKNENFAYIRSCYQEDSDDIVEWLKEDIDESIKLVKKYYGSELLPTTENNLSEVGDIINSYDDPYDVPADVYKAEFWLRVSSLTVNPVALYQAGRSADDILKVLNKNGNVPEKEWLFFGSMAISSYFASIERDDGTLDLTLIYYRVAEIFIYLIKYSSFGKEEAYRRHFRLMAEKALGKVEEVMPDTYNRAKKIPYFSCYYAEILYDFSKLYPDGEENLTDMCREYATMCVMGDEGEKYCTTCRDILKKLN